MKHPIRKEKKTTEKVGSHYIKNGKYKESSIGVLQRKYEKEEIRKL